MNSWGNNVSHLPNSFDMFNESPRMRSDFRSLSSGAYTKRANGLGAAELSNINSSKIMELYDLADATPSYDNLAVTNTRGFGSPARFNLNSQVGRRFNESTNYSDLSPMSSNYSADESETMSDQLLKEARARRNNNYPNYLLGGREMDAMTTNNTSGYRTTTTTTTNNNHHRQSHHTQNVRPKSAIIPGSSEVARHMSSLMMASDNVLANPVQDHLKTSPLGSKNGLVERYIESMSNPLAYQAQASRSQLKNTQDKYGSSYETSNYRCDSALSDRLQELMLNTAEDGADIAKSDYNDNQKYIHCIKDLVEENETLRRQCSLMLNERNYLQRKLDVACHEFLSNIKMQKAKWYREKEMLQTKINGLETIIVSLEAGGGTGGLSEDYIDDFSDPLVSIGDERGIYDNMHRTQASL